MSCSRIVAVAVVVLATSFLANAEYVVPFPVRHARIATNEEMNERDAWVERRFGSSQPQVPFSFSYGGVNSAESLRDWKVESSDEPTDARTLRRISWTDPTTGLNVTCETISYAAYPAVDWVVFFKNTGASDTAILENVHSLDIDIPLANGEDPVVHHAKGSDCTYTDFAPLESALPAEESLALSSHGRGGDRGGLPSVESMPFFNIEMAHGGMVFALGWSGPWEARFVRNDATKLSLQAGIEPIHAELRPGEEIRVARIVMLFWQNDRLRAHNLWRRLLLDHYSPMPGGKPFSGLIADGNWGSWMNADRHIEEIRWWGDHNLPIECYWVDAGWTDMSQGWEAHQSHQSPNEDLFPDGIRPLADAAHERGMRFLLWMVPGSVHPAVGIGKERPEWVGAPFTHEDYGSMVFYGLDQGDPGINQWMVGHFGQVVSDFGVDVFRQDGGNLWPEDMDPDRQGMSQLKYVAGTYAFWDGLLSSHPNLLIDNCAEGGRKIDIETIRRSILLWRSDIQASGTFDPVSNQGFNYGLFPWMPLCGGVVSVPNLSTYAFRSAYCPALLLGWPMAPVKNVTERWSTVDLDLLRKLLQEYISIRPYVFGDFYPLTPYSIEHDAWLAWQFDRPDLGEGMVQAFRRPECGDRDRTFQLHGLNPEARYVLTDRDTDATTVCSGAQLMTDGVRVSIPDIPGASLVVYRQEHQE